MKKINYWINAVACLGMVLTVFPADGFAFSKRSRKSCSSKTVDYVVIGSCAGGVLAKRLSDDKNKLRSFA